MPDLSPRPLPRRRVVSVASLIVLLQLATLPVLITLDSRDRGGEPEPETAEEPQPEPQIPAQDFSGSGRGHTETFEIEGGLTVFFVEHDMGGNFIVRLEDTDENRVAGLVNAIGSFEGSTATHVAAGEYVLEVRAVGDWSVTVEQPRYAGGESLPASYDGDQPAAAGPFELEEDATVEFALTHEGDGNFVVRLLDRDGQRVAGVANAQDDVDSTTELDVEAGVYLLDVEAEGPWTVDIE